MNKPLFHRSIAFIVCLIVCAFIAPTHAATAEQIQKSIAKGREYLFALQKNGHWETAGSDANKKQETGLTALCTYALLASGTSNDRQDPRLQAAVKYLLDTPAQGVYALGLRCQVWLLLPPTKETKAAMEKDARLLLASMKTEGAARGLYDYSFSKDKDYSNSRSQYGVLGLWAAEQMGLEIPSNVWRLFDEAWKRNQDRSGGWNYMTLQTDPQKTPLTPGMTAAGVATLFITQDYLYGSSGLDCKGNLNNDAIDKGVAWLADNFSKVATDEGYARDFHYVTLYAVERVGVASGLKYFKSIDWYQKGADWLVKSQGPKGNFLTKGKGSLGIQSIQIPVDTAFAILFLSRGGAPVVMNKLEYNLDGKGKKTEANWNQRPRDAANVVHWMARQMERDLNWQIVNLSVPAEALHDSPILYIAGNQALELSDDDEKKLKAFVEQGGMILGNADCATAAFTNSFRKLGAKLFPTYEFRELPAEHPIYTNGQYTRGKWKTKPSVLGLNNGVRELMILIPQADVARAWQSRNDKGKEELYQLLSNLYLYVSDANNLLVKGDSHWPTPDPKAAAPTRKISVARLQHTANWNPEPAGWERLSILMKNLHKVDLQVVEIKLGDGKLDAAKNPIAHLTGTTGVKFSDAERNDLKKFLAAGGTLIIDSAGGSNEFASSMDNELKQLNPDAELKTLPLEDKLYTGDAKNPLTIQYRPFSRRVVGDMKAPRLKALSKDGKFSILYSPDDLTAGLVGQPVDGVVGYTPATATAIMTRILLTVGK